MSSAALIPATIQPHSALPGGAQGFQVPEQNRGEYRQIFLLSLTVFSTAGSKDSIAAWKDETPRLFLEPFLWHSQVSITCLLEFNQKGLTSCLLIASYIELRADQTLYLLL